MLLAIDQGTTGTTCLVFDLQTRLTRDLYVMIIDVAVPPDPGLEALDASLQAVAAEQGVALTLRPADADVL